MGLALAPNDWFLISCHMKRDFHTKRIKSSQRIGPHNLDVISTLVGNLLGDGWGEKRSGSSRFHLHITSRNVEYLSWLQQFYAERGYCSPEKPKLLTQIGKGGKIYFSYKIRTWSFSSLNWLYDLFYQYNVESQKLVKRIPPTIETFLTPRVLAVWIMDDGAASSAGVRLCTQGFSETDVKLLQNALFSKFGLTTTLEKSGSNFALYVSKHQSNLLFHLVDPYMYKSMRYKLRNAPDFKS
jgi:hypothetical protein